MDIERKEPMSPLSDVSEREVQKKANDGRRMGAGEQMVQRQKNGRELLVDIALKLERQAFQLRRLHSAIPDEIHWEADAALRDILKPYE